MGDGIASPYLARRCRQCNKSWKKIMGRCHTKILIGNCFAQNNMENMCGIWVDSEKADYSLAIQKLNENEYFIIASNKVNKHQFDFAIKGTVVKENLIECILAEEKYYVYFDYEWDYACLLWNHIFPDPVYYDVRLERAEKVFDEELQLKKKQEENERLKQSVYNYLKSRK